LFHRLSRRRAAQPSAEAAVEFAEEGLVAREAKSRPAKKAGDAQAESGRAGGRAPGVISCAIHGLLSGDRAGAKLTAIKDASDFEQRILRADRPAIVVFYRGGCTPLGAVSSLTTLS
jgi:hypothetical protein